MGIRKFVCLFGMLTLLVTPSIPFAQHQTASLQPLSQVEDVQVGQRIRELEARLEALEAETRQIRDALLQAVGDTGSVQSNRGGSNKKGVPSMADCDEARRALAREILKSIRRLQAAVKGR